MDFQVIDIDTFEDREGNCIIRMFGRSSTGEAVTLHVHDGFMPFCYLDAPPTPNNFTIQHELTERLESAHTWRHATNKERKQMARKRRRMNDSDSDDESHDDDDDDDSDDNGGGQKSKVMIVVDHVVRKNIMHFQEDTGHFYRVSTNNPCHISRLRWIIEGARAHSLGYHTYECSVPLVIRYMVEKEVSGACWIHVRDAKKGKDDAHYEASDITPHPPNDPKWCHIADFVILSFDIECKGRQGVFPDPKYDPVIQIASVVRVGEAAAETIIMTLGTCAAINGANVCSFESEKDLLMAWRDLVMRWDPDILVGYNILQFDLPYLLDRAQTLGCYDFSKLSRVPGHVSTVKSTKFQSNQSGGQDKKLVDIPGRFILDMIVVVRANYKLHSYSLNSVSTHFLGDQKEDIHHSQISVLQDGTDIDRRRLATYCIKDADLPLRLMAKLLTIPNYVEMSRVTGVPLSYLLTRGQQIKVFSQILREAKKLGYVVPDVPRRTGGEVSYTGATVIEPKRGFYTCPIATLDFASLYPSIMIAHNLCFTSFIPKDRIAETLDILRARFPGLADEDLVTRTPSGDTFVKRQVCDGILPMILRNLLAARKVAKNEMAKATNDPMLRAVLDGRQNALKISANSVYGFTGASTGKLPLMEIASSVTSFGRQMIERTKQFVEREYVGSVVVYGDTDSVMVKFAGDGLTIAQAMELGAEAAGKVSKIFVTPIKLEFEKVFSPFLLVQKKRYAGLKFSKSADKPDSMDVKGMETVRRDNCPLTRETLQKVLDLILKTGSTDAAERYVKDIVESLLTNKIDMSKLIITRGLAKFEYKSKMPHAILAQKLAKRDPGSAPKVGDRVPYVMIAGDGLSSERAENPMYALEHDLPIDIHYYLDNQLKKPLIRTFGLFLGEDTESRLFMGDHTRKLRKVVSTKSQTGILRFARQVETCLGCRVGGTGIHQGLCATCEPRRREVMAREIDKFNEVEEAHRTCWIRCQRCQGTTQTLIVCAADDCSNFYKRQVEKVKFQKAQQVMQRLGAWDTWEV